MAKTALSHVAPKVALSAGGESRRPALGDGTAKPGDCVGIIQATGKVVQTEIGTSELFVGFLDINVETDMDTAIVDGVPCEIIVPQSGHVYNIHIEDPAATEGEGFSMTFSNTAGTMEGAASAILGLARMAEDAVTGDVYGKVRWD
jgi:hypothetical protein